MDEISRNGEFVCAFSTAFDHQRAQWEEIVYSENGLQVFSSVLQESATGTGKSITIAALAAHFGRIGVTTLILTNRQELVKSLYLTTRAAAEKVGCEIGLIWSDAGRGSATDDDEAAAIGEGIAVGWSAPIIVASVQTLARRPEMPPIGLVITDECHHEEADTWEGIYARVEAGNPDWKHVGFSATPYRTKNGRPVGLGGRFESYLTNTAFPYAAAVEAAVIVPLVGIKKTWLLTDAPADLEVKGDDYVMRQAVIDQLTTPGAIEHILRDLGEDRKQHGRVLRTLGFCCNRRHAEVMADEATRAGFRAAYVVGNSPDRAETIRRWRAGDIDVLFSADLFLEGFDAPEVEMIVKLRPCRSIGRGMQMFGRGTRPDPSLRLSEIPTVEGRRAAIAGSHKPVCLVRDYAHNPDVTPFGPDDVASTRKPRPASETPKQPVKVGDIVENTANPQFGPGVVKAIDGNTVRVDWSSGGSTKQPENNIAPFRVVGTEEEDAWRREGDPFGYGLAHLLAYVEEFGNARVPTFYVSFDGFALGLWVSKERQSKNHLSILESVCGWVSNEREARWQDQLARWSAFVAQYGRAPRAAGVNLTEEERLLGQWASSCRTDHRKGTLSAARIADCEALACWEWTPGRGQKTEDGRRANKAKDWRSIVDKASATKTAVTNARLLPHFTTPLTTEEAIAVGGTKITVGRLIRDGLVARTGVRGSRHHEGRRTFTITPAGLAELARLRAELADESEAAK